MKIHESTHASIRGMTPASDEILIDKTNKRIVLGDGETLGGVKDVKSERYFRSIESNYRRCFRASIGSVDPGASGATFVPPTANTIGGYRLNAAGELLYLDACIGCDWDGETDITMIVPFECNADNSGGTATDTIDLKLVAYYKGNSEVVTRSQTVEVSTVIGASPQYKTFYAEFTLDWDKADNVIKDCDRMHLILNLETDTSEVDDIVINPGPVLYYMTTHAGLESGDVG